MPLNLSFTHIMVVLLVALIVLGPERLPDAARTTARVIRELRQLSSGLQAEVRETFGEFAEPFSDLVSSVTGGVAAATSGVPDGDPPPGPAVASAPPLSVLPPLGPLSVLPPLAPTGRPDGDWAAAAGPPTEPPTGLPTEPPRRNGAADPPALASLPQPATFIPGPAPVTSGPVGFVPLTAGSPDLAPAANAPDLAPPPGSPGSPPPVA